ncbi:TetR/AcrR family transcriptional regulator [Acidipila sp. EB88]|uniref:TetR/AcrR family transcriptional regulator n=1 Tax=Acidipila sp. EB88 TaxID=2305226 RepID=UPI000F5F3C18|nr:TetR/AcrR family transcriptional regulator [Acidipila sp. EB88]RRA47686.1 TetR/AcrR family transcriptional regulator [Acidipila sp. EB88]
MGAADRRTQEREGMRSKILIAAADLIREDGYDNLTIRKVADRIEYSPMALYNHFPDKDAILKTLAEEGFERFLSGAPKRSSLPPIDELRRYMLAYVQFAVKHPEQYRLIFMTQREPAIPSASKDHPAVQHIPAGSGRQAFERLVDSVNACAAEYPVFKDAFAVSLFLWTGIHGASSLLITFGKFPFGSPKQYAEATVERMLSGLMATGYESSSQVRRQSSTRV